MLPPFVTLVAVGRAGPASHGHVTRSQSVESASKIMVVRTQATAYRDAQWSSVLHNNAPVLKKRSMVWCNNVTKSAAHDASGSIRRQNYLADPVPPSTCEEENAAAEPAMPLPCQREEMENRHFDFLLLNFGLDIHAIRSRTRCTLFSRCTLAHFELWKTYKEQAKAEHRRWQVCRVACNTGSPVVSVGALRAYENRRWVAHPAQPNYRVPG